MSRIVAIFAFSRRFETTSAHACACGEACAAGSFEARRDVDMTHVDHVDINPFPKFARRCFRCFRQV